MLTGVELNVCTRSVQDIVTRVAKGNRNETDPLDGIFEN